MGESPLWDPRDQVLYWVDAYAGAIQRLDATGGLARWPLPGPIGSLVLREAGGLVGAMEGGFFFVDLGAPGEPARLQAICDPAGEVPGTLLNDGKCDPRGRYWCGSRDRSLTHPIGRLYRLGAEGKCSTMDEGFIVSNGIAFSPEGKTLYLADSRQHTVFAYDFDLDSGAIRNRRVFVTTHAVGGRPDGATVDSQGYYWCALVHGGAIARFAPDGRLDRRVELPVRHPTMCSFGGPGLDVLYVTSANAMLADDERASQPLAGALFAIEGLGVRGLAEPRFKG
ncbi:SMP-30/gluconolactonase/LRE family protein [Variovorax sp. OV329]|uniref:SMP-30/gluconolactonase/LRE family protein n=1 Tax=Variovorax sp. OV329 TaxID=1882825 RepID=UPI001C312A65|nr:SMP-30/gluconolactonase/LRE family protein [Variovorax sp. OV329]